MGGEPWQHKMKCLRQGPETATSGKALQPCLAQAPVHGGDSVVASHVVLQGTPDHLLRGRSRVPDFLILTESCYPLVYTHFFFLVLVFENK